jgi:protocatechuate 3,4-dioxygenase beta subunit
MNNKPIQQNLKHGYIFLAGIILVLFGISFATEMYFKGAFAFDQNQPEIKHVEVINNNADSEEIFLEIQNLESGFKTKEEQITVVVFTNKDNEAWINQEKIDVDNQGIFETQIDLIVGENEIIIEVKSIQEESIQESITVIREALAQNNEEPVKEESQEVKVDPPKQVIPPVTNIKPPVIKPTPELPSEPPLTGLKLQCSITNTQPSIGQTVTLNCTVKDQNNNAVNGATGSITINWQSGSQTYPLSTSESAGNMSKSFVVPNGNTGSILGVVKATKSGLTVTSNFNLTVQ